MMTKEQTDKFYSAIEFKLNANRAKSMQDNFMILGDGDMCVEFKGQSFMSEFNADSEEYLAIVYAANLVNIPLSEFGL